MARFFKRRRNVVLLVIFAGLAVSFFIFQHSIGTHLRAVSILQRFSSPDSNGFFLRLVRHQVEIGESQNKDAPFHYRLYKPLGVTDPPGVVLLHGVHHLGIEDPRLVNFARAVAETGVVVMTPELQDLADYHITSATVNQIDAAVVFLSKEVNQGKVGVMGLSFAGSLALLAACDPQYADRIGFVLAIGSYDDLSRVSRFFATNTIEDPNGKTVPFAAHEYGVLILAYSHLEDFFSAQDVPIAREALRLWLWEKPEASRFAEQLSPAGRAEWELLLHHRDQLRQKFLDEIKLHQAEMEPVSPHGQLQGLKVPVFLLHASGDSVIPASETSWLERDVPQQDLKAVLISPALIHVNMAETVTLRQKWDVVHFLAQVVGGTDALR
ncbi:MAG TPA: hypothetical protein VI636_11775 [Candidatus Angelobacter sp.]